MATYLDEIVAHHRAQAATDDRSLAELEKQLIDCPNTRDFVGALRRRPKEQIAVIAEIKRRSPSRGDLAMDLDPGECARAYAHGGATCISVLTDAEYFGAHLGDLEAVHEAVALPILRKDFTVSTADLYDARAMGADAVLLIVAALSDEELRSFVETAGELGLGVLVEVHDEEELGRAIDANAVCIGVNQRDLRSFEVDPERALVLAEIIPPGVVKVAESGIRTPREVAQLRRAGFDAVLIGESLVTASDRGRALREMLTTGADDEAR